jgi:hypothetical protein
MDHPRMGTPLMVTCFGLLATIGWMAVLAYDIPNNKMGPDRIGGIAPLRRSDPPLGQALAL